MLDPTVVIASKGWTVFHLPSTPGTAGRRPAGAPPHRGCFLLKKILSRVFLNAISCRTAAGQPLSGVPVLANPNETAAILVIGKPVHLSGMRSLRPSLSSRRSTSAHAAGYIQTSDGAGAPRISIAWPSCPCRSHKQPEPRGRAEGRVSRRCVRRRVRVQEEGGGGGGSERGRLPDRRDDAGAASQGEEDAGRGQRS